MTIVRLNQFQSAAGKAQELHEFLTSITAYILGSEGCQSCEVFQQQNDDSHFVVIEKWDSIESHQASIANYPKEDMMAAMNLFGAPPKGDYYTI
jgi:quinol monooxygenase YgiN